MQEQSDKDVSSSNSAIDLTKILQDLHLVSEDGVLIEQRSKQESTSQRKKTVPKNNYKNAPSADTKRYKVGNTSVVQNASHQKTGKIYIVQSTGKAGKKCIQTRATDTPAYNTPDMDTPLSSLPEIPKHIVQDLARMQIHDVGDLCMIRRNGLERNYLLSNKDLNILCELMRQRNVVL